LPVKNKCCRFTPSLTNKTNIMNKIYHVEKYNEFTKEIKDAFGDLDDGFEIANNLEKIGFMVIDIDMSGYFEEFTKAK